MSDRLKVKSYLKIKGKQVKRGGGLGGEVIYIALAGQTPKCQKERQLEEKGFDSCCTHHVPGSSDDVKGI